MKRTNTFAMLAASFGLLFGSCSEETELNTSSGEDASSCAVHITLDSSAVVVPTRANTVPANADEKQVTSLYAVVFKDANADAVTGQKNREDNGDTFFKCIDVLNGTSMQGGQDYTFEVGDPGSYQICFVANPSNKLKTKIEGLGGKTVADFKALTEEQTPEHKPMLMTSDFFGAAIAATANAELGSVDLTRAMARIDIVNKAPGVKITKAVFRNRAIHTVLIADNKTATLQMARAERTYDNINLDGAADGSKKYEALIYSYEQYGSGNDAPSMDISYTIGGKSYTHKVAFKTAAPDNKPINLKRNTLYRLVLSNESGKLSLELTVADWNRGEEFTVSTEEIKDGINVAVTAVNLNQTNVTLFVGESVELTATVVPDNATNKSITWSSSNPKIATVEPVKKLGTAVVHAVAVGEVLITAQSVNGITARCAVAVKAGIAYSQAAVGDFMLKDGTLVRPGVTSDFEAKKKDAIGIVFCTDKNRIGAGAKSKLNGNVHGLVMSLQQPQRGIWKFQNTFSGLPLVENAKQCYEDIDGYNHTQKIFADGGDKLATKYPAFYAVKTFDSGANKAPAGTTGWYLPAIGEWYDILEGLGEVKIDQKYKTDASVINPIFLEEGVGCASRAITNIQNKVAVAGGNFRGLGREYVTYWSSSECSAEGVKEVCFDDELLNPLSRLRRGISICDREKSAMEKEDGNMNCVLAF